MPRAAWLEKLLAGDHRAFEQVWLADKLVWPLSGWSRLIRLSILASCNFQSADASAPSGHCWVKIRCFAGSCCQQKSRNKQAKSCLFWRLNWVKIELSLDVSEDVFAPHHMSMALIGYGKHLFYAGAPKYQFAETINAVIDRFPTYRGLVAAAWGTLKKWEEAEPTERAMVMPAAVFKAAVSLSLLWSWPRFAAALYSGFHGLLRPAEFIPLKRGGLILPWTFCLLRLSAMCEYYTQKPADSCLANMLGYLTPLPYNICRGCLGILASMNFCLVAVLRCFALAGIVCLKHWVSQLQKINEGSPPNHCVVLVPLGSSTTLKMWASCFGVGSGSPDAHLNITCKTLWVRCCCQIFLSHSGMPFWNLVMHRSFGWWKLYATLACIHVDQSWMWSQMSHILYPVDAVPALLFQLLGHETLSVDSSDMWR